MKYGFFVVGLFLILGCKKENGPDDDTSAPVISFTTPANNQVFTAGQTVNISATITDASNLDEIHLEILNTTTNTLYTHEHFAPSSPSYNLASSFVIPSAASYRIKVEAIDKSNNEGESQITISAP